MEGHTTSNTPNARESSRGLQSLTKFGELKKPKAILHALGLVNSRMKRDSNSRRILPSHAFEACSLDRSDIHPLTIRATKSRANATFQL